MTTSILHISHGYNQEEWCENVFQWLKKDKLSKELENVHSEIKLKNVIKALDVMNGRIADRLENQTMNLKSFLTPQRSCHTCQLPSLQSCMP
eukprot:4525684-Amphidinium_carterae.1